MAVTMDGSTRPFEYDREIAIRGGAGITLGNAKSLLLNEIAGKLPYPCIKCGATGLLNAGTEICDNCNGWTATEVPQTPVAPVEFTPDSPDPIPTYS